MKNRLSYFVLILIFVADRLLKELSLKKFSLLSQEDFFIIPKILNFTLFKNESLAFGLPLPVKLIVLISVFILAVLFILLLKNFKERNSQNILMLNLIILGALSNLQDRVSLGFVVDYFHLYPISYFNLADLMIGLGIMLLISRTKNFDIKNCLKITKFKN